jgi:hypothetical protein
MGLVTAAFHRPVEHQLQHHDLVAKEQKCYLEKQTEFVTPAPPYPSHTVAVFYFF